MKFYSICTLQSCMCEFPEEIFIEALIFINNIHKDTTNTITSQQQIKDKSTKNAKKSHCIIYGSLEWDHIKLPQRNQCFEKTAHGDCQFTTNGLCIYQATTNDHPCWIHPYQDEEKIHFFEIHFCSAKGLITISRGLVLPPISLPHGHSILDFYSLFILWLHA